MTGGYMGKVLFVDLSTGTIKEEALDEKTCRDFVGGYGIGVRTLYSRMKAGVDALGPDNMLGLVAGPMTGTPTPTGARYQTVAKSPLTNGWGDANSGGDFGPFLKFAGFDGVFFTGISPKPVYLLLDNGKASIKDAGDVWGKDSYETEDTLTARHGSDSRVACIGQAGEKLSLISAIMTDRGSTAGRSGLGAVMGSKRLKAVVAKGSQQVPLADRVAVEKLRAEQIKIWSAPGPTGVSQIERQHKYGTSAMTYASAHTGDAPVKNWGGVGVIDLPDRAGLHGDAFAALVEKGHGCWHCPLACKAFIKAGVNYKYPAGSRRPEYETAAAFGPNCANSNTESICAANDICNRYGLDTISAGTIISFATELYENGILTRQDTGGIDLKWGNHQAMVAMTQKMADRDGIGDALADGVAKAAEKIGKGADKFAVHIGGEELGMHDPKLMPMGRPGGTSASRYHMDPTPGRHTANFGPSGFRIQFVNSAGLCMMGFGFGSTPESEARLVAFFNGVTGFGWTMADVLKAGERILTLRHSFNLREGINPLKRPVHGRIIGTPPQTAGPLAGVTADLAAQNYWNLGAMDWDRITTKPSKAKLMALGLTDVANDLWPDAPPGPPR